MSSPKPSVVSAQCTLKPSWNAPPWYAQLSWYWSVVTKGASARSASGACVAASHRVAPK